MVEVVRQPKRLHFVQPDADRRSLWILLMSLAVLMNNALPLPILLDTVRHAETGHLSLDQARNARSRAGAVGPYQFLERFLPEFGYGMPTDIPLADVQDPARARELAGQYITGYSQHHNFTTPLQKLVAYNMAPSSQPRSG